MINNINFLIKRIIDFFLYPYDFFRYYKIYKKYSGDAKTKTSQHLKAELRRSIHAFEISQTLQSGRHDRGLENILKLKKNIETSRKFDNLADIVSEGEKCINIFSRNTTIDPEILRKRGILPLTNLVISDLKVTVKYKNQYTLEKRRSFQELVRSRRSVREYSSNKVSQELIKEAIQDSLFTPSACNREPWKTYDIISNKNKAACLELQNNSSSLWREKASLLLITVDLSMYKGYREKNAPFIDGGMFSMSLIYSLYSKGIDTCPLNLNLSSNKLILLQKMLGLQKNEIPIMLIAYGKANIVTDVPLCKRKTVNEVYHSI